MISIELPGKDRDSVYLLYQNIADTVTNFSLVYVNISVTASGNKSIYIYHQRQSAGRSRLMFVTFYTICIIQQEPTTYKLIKPQILGLVLELRNLRINVFLWSCSINIIRHCSKIQIWGLIIHILEISKYTKAWASASNRSGFWKITIANESSLMWRYLWRYLYLISVIDKFKLWMADEYNYSIDSNSEIWLRLFVDTKY